MVAPTTPNESLAVQVLAAHERAVKNERAIDELRGTVGGIASVVPDLAEAVAELANQVRSLLPPQEAPAPVWDWTSMDQVQAAHAWKELRGWVEGEFATYYAAVGQDDPLKIPAKTSAKVRLRVPACWAGHMDVVIELSWLYQEWERLYRSPAGTPARAGDWHSRYLPGVLHRIRYTSTAAHCVRMHTSLGEKDGASRSSDEPFDTEAAIIADVQSRRPPKDATPGP